MTVETRFTTPEGFPNRMQYIVVTNNVLTTLALPGLLCTRYHTNCRWQHVKTAKIYLLKFLLCKKDKDRQDKLPLMKFVPRSAVTNLSILKITVM